MKAMILNFDRTQINKANKIDIIKFKDEIEKRLKNDTHALE